MKVLTIAMCAPSNAKKGCLTNDELDGPLLTTQKPEQKVRAGHLPQENKKQRQGTNCPPAGRQDRRSEQ